MSEAEAQDPAKPPRKSRKKAVEPALETASPGIQEKPKRTVRKKTEVAEIEQTVPKPRTRKVKAEIVEAAVELAEKPKSASHSKAVVKDGPAKTASTRKKKAEVTGEEDTEAAGKVKRTLRKKPEPVTESNSPGDNLEEKPKRKPRKKVGDVEAGSPENNKTDALPSKIADRSQITEERDLAHNSLEVTETHSGKSGVKRTSVKRIQGTQTQDGSQVVERVSSLTDNTPVDVLPTQAVPSESLQKNDRNQRQQQGRNRFQNNRPNNRFQKQNGQNRNNKFNKNRNNRRDNQHYQETPLVETGPPFETGGMLEFAPKGYGFLRTQENDFDQTTGGVYVSPEIIKRFSLRPCQWIHGMALNTSRGVQLREVISVNGIAPEESRKLPHFEDLKAVNPHKRYVLESTPERYTTRVLDMMAPIGYGQRGLIVAPPRTGKTVLLQHIAEAIVEKYGDEVHLMILLIDERPEEVTEFKRGIKGAEVFASSNDGRVREHCRLAELCIERAKRLVESGRHVFILMDSITRLARAYNNASAGNGRTMSGGIDARALEMPRRLFAAARNTREAGSLTIIATALIETNSRMDDLIFQEFKGTGNMELVLNRRIAEQYIYPAVDILKSGTRREELILPEIVLDKVNLIRRALAGHRPVEAMERLLFFLKKYPNNAQMLIDLKQRA